MRKSTALLFSSISMINFSYAQDNQMHKEMWKEWEPIERDFPKTWDIDIIRPRE